MKNTKEQKSYQKHPVGSCQLSYPVLYQKSNFFQLVGDIFNKYVYFVTIFAKRNIIKMAEEVITIVTSSQLKLQEIISILGTEISSSIKLSDIDLPECQGEIDEVCEHKCKEALKHLNTAVIVEDTSLCFNALGGLPGPYIKWFVKKLGASGLPRLLADFPDKTAVGVCTIGYADQTGNVKLFRGETEGTIVTPRGTNGFGWDSCFVPKGYSQTYAEMPSELKNSLSHRCKAVLKLKEHIVNLKT